MGNTATCVTETCVSSMGVEAEPTSYGNQAEKKRKDDNPKKHKKGPAGFESKAFAVSSCFLPLRQMRRGLIGF